MFGWVLQEFRQPLHDPLTAAFLPNRSTYTMYVCMYISIIYMYTVHYICMYISIIYMYILIYVCIPTQDSGSLNRESGQVLS